MQNGSKWKLKKVFGFAKKKIEPNLFPKMKSFWEEHLLPKSYIRATVNYFLAAFPFKTANHKRRTLARTQHSFVHQSMLLLWNSLFLAKISYPYSAWCAFAIQWPNLLLLCVPVCVIVPVARSSSKYRRWKKTVTYSVSRCYPFFWILLNTLY